MYPFASYILRSYYSATGWNEDNLYTNFTRSSGAILDFTVPRGLHLSVSKSPNALFKTTYSMTALPSLNGSFGYIFTSSGLDINSSACAPFNDLVEHSGTYDTYNHKTRTQRDFRGRYSPEPSSDVIRKFSYLLYGRFYIPTGRLDALYSARLSQTLQASLAAISEPPSRISMHRRALNPSNIMLNVQHNVGSWCTEYTWSAEDAMWGFKVLHNFDRTETPKDRKNESEKTFSSGSPDIKQSTEQPSLESSQKGRVSIGAELYFSAKERSAGVSTGIRYITPSPVPKTINSKPLTTITALFNPMLGHVSGSYTAEVSRDLAVSSRFDFNVYSYESEWTMGAEWWLWRSPSPSHESSKADEEGKTALPLSSSVQQGSQGDIHGVVKARASTNNNIALMWEGRLRKILVSLGVISDFSSQSKPVQAFGLEFAYFGSE